MVETTNLGYAYNFSEMTTGSVRYKGNSYLIVMGFVRISKAWGEMEWGEMAWPIEECIIMEKIDEVEALHSKAGIAKQAAETYRQNITTKAWNVYRKRLREIENDLRTLCIDPQKYKNLIA